MDFCSVDTFIRNKKDINVAVYLNGIMHIEVNEEEEIDNTYEEVEQVRLENIEMQPLNTGEEKSSQMHLNEVIKKNGISQRKKHQLKKRK